MLHQHTVFCLALVSLAFFGIARPAVGQGVTVDSASSVLPRGFRNVQITPIPASKGGGFQILGGGGLGTGPLHSTGCKEGDAECIIDVKAAAVPQDGDDDDDKDCVVRVTPSMRLAKSTTILTWKLNAKQLKKGFAFYGDGVVLDDTANFSDIPKVTGKDTVTAKVKPHTVGDIASYTVYLMQNGSKCAGYDPIIVNRDN